MRVLFLCALAVRPAPAEWVRQAAAWEGVPEARSRVDAVETSAGRRGLQLSTDDGESFWLTAAQADGLRRIARQLDAGVGRTRSGYFGYIGSCEFCDRPQEHPLQGDYYMGADAPGLRLYFRRPRTFAGRRPADLAALLEAGLAELRRPEM